MKARLFVIAAPSGAGKTSLVRALLEKLDAIRVSVSYTTRAPRPNDQADVDYHFISDAEFDQMVQADAFLEHANVHGRQYGTGREWVLKQLQQGTDVILEIDWQGAEQVQRLFPEAVSVFILPPSYAELRQRLERRQQDSEEVITQRLAAARDEVEHYQVFDYLLVNRDFDQTLDELRSIVLAERCQTSLRAKREAELLADLLETR